MKFTIFLALFVLMAFFTNGQIWSDDFGNGDYTTENWTISPGSSMLESGGYLQSNNSGTARIYQNLSDYVNLYDDNWVYEFNFSYANLAAGDLVFVELTDSNLGQVGATDYFVFYPYYHSGGSDERGFRFTSSSSCGSIDINQTYNFSVGQEYTAKIKHFTFDKHFEMYINDTLLLNQSVVGFCDYEGLYTVLGSNTLNADYNYFTISEHNDTIENYLLTVFYDEETRELIESVTLEIIGNDTSVTYTNINGSRLFYYANETELELRYTSTGYDLRVYYVNLTEDASIDLYLLNSTNSDQIILNVFNQDADPAENTTVLLQRQYGNQYITVSMSKVNFDGSSVLYAELYDVWYKILYQDTDGSIAKITAPFVFTSVNPSDTINFEEDLYLSWRKFDTVYTSPVTFVNSSGDIYATFSFADTNSFMAEACLNVDLRTVRGVTNICDNCTNASSGSLSCYINTSLEGEYVAYALIDTATESSWYQTGEAFYNAFSNPQFGQEGIFFTIMIMGSMAMMGLATIISSVLFMIFGLVGMVIAGFVTGFSIGWVWYLVTIGMIIVFIARGGGK